MEEEQEESRDIDTYLEPDNSIKEQHLADWKNLEIMYLSKGLPERSPQKGSAKRCAKCPRRQDQRTKSETGEVEVCRTGFGPSKSPPNFYTVSCVRVCSEASV